MNYRASAEKVVARNDLSAPETQELVEAMFDGSLPASRTAFLLGALRAKGESAAELLGTSRVMRRHARFIDCGGRDAIDIVGTGGDGKNTFNISTTATFVACGAGVVIAKHGNRSASSMSGSADVLAALGFNLDCAPEQMEAAIRDIGIGFLFAAKMHPGMGRLAPLRRELGTRTLFNLAGPLCNPAGAIGTVLGVFAPEFVEIYAEVLRDLGCKRAFVVHGMEGLDEISVASETRVCELDNGDIKTYSLYPEMLIGQRFAENEIAGGTPAENAAITRAVLDGAGTGAQRAIVLLNAAAAIVAGGVADNLPGALELAKESIASGAARGKLARLIEYSR
ncbi:MAG: anthranilate phosphoribosyltransferase [Opitutaceae bacterium]|jgi:anthranilate phosphoribosyltransferase|nr:anthranilate phosphoribosyltransferase [Opitutaceae bacterium]